MNAGKHKFPFRKGISSTPCPINEPKIKCDSGEKGVTYAISEIFLQSQKNSEISHISSIVRTVILVFSQEKPQCSAGHQREVPVSEMLLVRWFGTFLLNHGKPSYLEQMLARSLTC